MFIYSQSTGKFWNDAGNAIATGYAGFGNSKNKPQDEAVENLGPIPRGVYAIGEPYHAPKAGPYFLPLTPVGHNAKGRTQFGIHGDSIKNPGTASNGCVILPRDIRLAVYNSNDKYLKVIE